MNNHQNTYQAPYPQQAPAQADGCLDWEGEIQQEGGSFVLLDPGIYPFTVKSFARERYTPREGSKIPACNQARVTVLVNGAELDEKFPLHTKMEWKISQLYAALGMKAQGERVRMNWPAIQGRSGYLEIGVRTWQKRDGSGEGRSNEIKRFLAPWDEDYPKAAPQPAAPYTSQPTAQPVYQQQTIPGANPAPTPWSAGRF